jgi:hypothetical protein
MPPVLTKTFMHAVGTETDAINPWLALLSAATERRRFAGVSAAQPIDPLLSIRTPQRR